MPRATSTAYDEIRQRILDGSYPAGSRLRETKLSNDIGVSRTPIRDALRRLQAEGLVVTTANRGARVATWSQQSVDDIVGMRLRLEPYAAKLAADRIDNSGLMRLSELASQMEDQLRRKDSGYPAAITELNNQFHELLVKSAGSDAVVNLLNTVVTIRSSTAVQDEQMPLVRRWAANYTQEELVRSIGHHHELVAALKVRDAEWAESVMRTHILAGRAATRNESK